MIKLYALFLLNLSLLFSIQITGKVLDSGSNIPLIGANVYIENTEFGAATDIDGYFVIDGVEPGEYKIIVSYISYKTSIEMYTIDENNTDFIFLLKEDSLKGDEIKVIGKIKKSNEYKKIKEQKESKDILSTFSASEIRKSGDSNAAQALKRITGVTVVEGKNVVIRGLGDRYTQARVNSLIMPSTDPDKRTLPLDLFSTKVIEKVNVYKSYHPKLPGNFAGGSVDVITKSYPDDFMLKFSLSNSSNSELQLSDIVLSNNGYVSAKGDYSQFNLDLSVDAFGSNYIFETTPQFFSDYHETSNDMEDEIFDNFLYNSKYDSNADFLSNFYTSDDEYWKYFYYLKLSDSSKDLAGSYKRNQINSSDLNLFGIQLPSSPISFSFMNGNKFRLGRFIEYGYFLNLSYANKFSTESEIISEYAKIGDLYRAQYNLVQEKHSFNTNLSSLLSTGIKFKLNRDNYMKIDYNYMDIITSKNESMRIESNETYYELDNGGLSLSDKISQKSISSHHIIFDIGYRLNKKIDFQVDVYYNDSKSNLNMPDMKQQTYHKNIYIGNNIWDQAEEFNDLNGNGQWDNAEQYIDLGNGQWDNGELFVDQGNGYWNVGENFSDNGVYNSDSGSYIGGGNGAWDFADLDGDGLCNNSLDQNGDGIPGSFADQECENWNELGNGIYDEGENFVDLGNGIYDVGEEFIDTGLMNGTWDGPETFVDLNGDGVWNDAEQFVDTNSNGVWDEGEEIIQDRIDYNNEMYRYLSLVEGQGENGVKPTKRTWIYGGEDQESYGYNSSINYQLNKDLNLSFLFGYDDLLKSRSFSKREFTMGTNSQSVIFNSIFNPNNLHEGAIFDQEDKYFSISFNEACECFVSHDGLYMMESSSLASNNSYRVSEGTYGRYFLFSIDKKYFLGLEGFTFSSGLRYEKYDLKMQPFNTVTGELLWRASSKNGVYDKVEPYLDGNENGLYDPGESFLDLNNNNAWNPEEEFEDLNQNGVWDDGESFVDQHAIVLINSNKNEKTYLPAFNLILSQNDLFKYRFSYSNTLARPQYRELAPTKYEEFYSDRAVEGNPYLKTTRISNIDFRFEFYPNKTNMYSFAIYRKFFKDPIALVIRPGSSHNYISYSNSKSANLLGLEVEIINKINFIPIEYGKFSIGSNLSYIKSSTESYNSFVSYMGDTLTNISNKKVRPMMGQSDIIFNGNLGWSSLKNILEFNLALSYNSKRLLYVGDGEISDEYEYPRPSLNFTSKYTIRGIELSFKVKNLLDSEVLLGIENNDVNTIYYTKRFKPGITYNFSFGYSL
ncbi:MAG: hypothetical protein CBD58_01515 [bacterium TMED198]|nr:MAG: hypothetical protein CBD58_01515 [bacterium TMED198]